MKFRGHGQKFLNLPGLIGPSMIRWYVETKQDIQPVWETKNDERVLKTLPWQFAPEVSLQISDCNRVIDFDFDFSGPEHRRNNVRKLNVLIQQLQALRDALDAETALYERAVERYGLKDPWNN